MTHSTSQDARPFPSSVKQYLTARCGLSAEAITRFGLGWTGDSVTIPAAGRDGAAVGLRAAKWDPTRRELEPVAAQPEEDATLYGWENLESQDRSYIFICDGEFNRLALESQRIRAVTGTGGPGLFQEDWAIALSQFVDIFVCFNKDAASQSGVERVLDLLPEARVVDLPEEVGPEGQIVDYFGRLGGSRSNFVRLLAKAQVLPVAQSETAPAGPNVGPDGELEPRVRRIQAKVAIERVAELYIPGLRRSGVYLTGPCPFHRDEHSSLVIRPAEKHFGCPSCGRQGDVIRFMMELEDLDRAAAVEKLEAYVDAATDA